MRILQHASQRIMKVCSSYSISQKTAVNLLMYRSTSVLHLQDAAGHMQQAHAGAAAMTVRAHELLGSLGPAGTGIMTPAGAQLLADNAEVGLV